MSGVGEAKIVAFGAVRKDTIAHVKIERDGKIDRFIYLSARALKALHPRREV